MPFYSSYISIKQRFLIIIALLVLVTATTLAITLFLAKPKTQVADVVLTEDTLQYDGKKYKKAPAGTENLYGISQGAIVYEWIDPDNPNHTEVMYFPAGSDPAKANTVYSTSYTLADNGTQTIQGTPQPILMAPVSTDGNGLQGNDGGTGGNTSNSPNANGGDSTPGKSDPKDGIVSSTDDCPSTTAINTSGSIIYCGKEYKSLPANKIDPKDANNTLPPIDDGMGYFIYESKDGGVEIIVAPITPLDPKGKDIYKTADIYSYPNAEKNKDGTWSIGTASRDGSGRIEHYIPPLPTGTKSSIDPQNYQAIEDENEKAITAYQKQQAEAERKAKLAGAGKNATDAANAAAAAAEKDAEEQARIIANLEKYGYAIHGIAATCATQTFITFPAWYRGLVDGNCEFTAPKDGSELRTTIFTIILNIVEIILQLVGYASAGMIIFGGYKYMTSTGSPDGMVGARKTIMNAVIGLVVSLAATAIVNTIVNNL